MKKEAFVAMALEYLGYPASNYGGPDTGKNEDGFDCSGFVHFLLRKSKYPDRISRHASEFFDSLGIFVHEQLQSIGDLVFFSNRGGMYPDHIGIMVSGDEYIHSPGMNGKVICVEKLRKKIIPVKNNNQIYLFNPIGFKRITIRNGRYQKMFLS